ncbi:MAG: ComF family protein [Anaplasmataceae bacterium]|nr:ComF family protein [Anaplasmataceae bacterium]
MALSIKHLLFPSLCLSCYRFIGHQEGALCSSCQKTITLFRNLLCGRCRARLPESSKICHPDSYLLGIAASYHQSPIERSFRALKFKYTEEAALFFSELLITFFQSLDEKPSLTNNHPLVVHIPLSKARLKERGFDQSEIIAKNFASSLNLTFKTDILHRFLDRPPQSLLKNKKERQGNILGVFKATPNHHSKRIPLILIDDITTTGATIDEAVKTLRQAHYGPILALTVAG